jgi:menaquinone-specific isochorismate synthase
MPTLPNCFNCSQDRKDLYQVLSICQQKIVQRDSQIISIAAEIDGVDPLAVLHELAAPDQPHFYLEKRFEDQAVAAIGAIAALETSGTLRFSQAQQFIDSCFDRLSLIGDVFPLSLPRFFCSFTFFDQSQKTSLHFPSASIFLPQWQVLRQHDRCVAITNLVMPPQCNLEALTDTIWQQFQTIRLAKYGIFNLPDSVLQTLNSWKIIDTHPFKAAVQSALGLIEQKQLNKLVVAHAVDVISRLPFQTVQSLHRLRTLHPESYVFSTSSGKGQSFMGASPERLIKIHNSLLATDALAGSAPRGQTIAADTELAAQLFSSQKERLEHQVVVDFIRQRLTHLGLTPQFLAVPDLLKLPNIQHLHTPIRAKMSRQLQPLDLVAALHPTPAVAGTPRAIACQQIHRYEAFERSLYAAPLGWVDAQGNAEFIVGIRSAVVEGCHARLYAGAGIVAGSNPDREFTEVKLKLQALMQALV